MFSSQARERGVELSIIDSAFSVDSSLLPSDVALMDKFKMDQVRFFSPQHFAFFDF
jgi:hypothetical protein